MFLMQQVEFLSFIRIRLLFNYSNNLIFLLSAHKGSDLYLTSLKYKKFIYKTQYLKQARQS